ncbi:MAG: M48 family metalloprotease [Burkholderiales bacterium]|nr:M48 family metalloprotease [Phycisphaerae bacterium]
MLIVAAGCATDKAVIAQANDAHKELSPAVVRDPVLDGYVQQLGDRIVRTAREMDQQGYGPKSHKSEDSEWMFKDIQFHLVNSPTLNAFTTGGQHIYLYSELLLSCKTEDEFAAVVAHEFGHIYARHVQKGMDRQYAILGGAALAAVGGAAIAGQENWQTGAGVGAGVGLAAGQFLGMGFTRNDEDEADRVGFVFYTRSGWDPGKFDGFFRTMIEKGHDKTPEAISDHPKLATRVANTERRIKELPPSASQWRRPNTAGPQRFAELQSRAKAYQKKVPKDKSLEAAQLMLAAFPSCVAPTDLPEQKSAQKKVVDAINRQKAKQ